MVDILKYESKYKDHLTPADFSDTWDYLDAYERYGMIPVWEDIVDPTLIADILLIGIMHRVKNDFSGL